MFLAMIELIAFNITNLTDARYFAARGAKYIFYKVTSQADIVKINTLQEWISGPELGIELDPELNNDEKEKMVQELLPKAIWISNKENANRIVIDNFEIKVISTEDLSEIEQDSYLHKETWSNEEINLIKKLPIRGIVFNGTPETKVGIKNYDTLDLVLDEIEQINAEEEI